MRMAKKKRFRNFSDPRLKKKHVFFICDECFIEIQNHVSKESFILKIFSQFFFISHKLSSASFQNFSKLRVLFSGRKFMKKSLI